MASADRSTESEEYIAGLYNPVAVLPIAQHKRALQYVVDTYPVTILIGETGCGKTTQLPQYLLERGGGGLCIAVTQPRRVAATTVATRVAHEMGVTLGEEVGYSIRFEDVTTERTKIKYMTDGMLLREIMVDPLLRRYSVVMVDEAHERSVSTDVLLGVLKKIRRKRKDLRIVVASATLQAEEFAAFFNDSEEEQKEAKEERGGEPVAKIVGIEGRMFPVDVAYLAEPTEDYLERSIETVFDIHLRESPGDILVFLTGRDEIDRAVTAVQERSADLHPNAPKLLPLPLYAGLSSEQQLYVFDAAPENHRKVVFSTNIAEASVTIDGIVFVIDCGFVKLRVYDPTTGIETLAVTATSKAAATQRAGRAGRTKPGRCFRLYQEKMWDQLQDASVPELVRSNLASVILQLKALGIDNIIKFDFLSPPPVEQLARALELLYSLGALDDYAKLTRPLGTRMADLPVPPMLAKILLASVDRQCFSQILSIAAMTTVQNVFITPDDQKKPAESMKRLFTVDEGDHLTLLNVYIAFTTRGKHSVAFCKQHFLNYKALTRAVAVRGQLWRYLERFYPNLAAEQDGCNLATGDRIRQCLVQGYFAHAARFQADGTYRFAGSAGSGRGSAGANESDGATVLWAHPSSVMFNRKAEWVVFHEIVETGGKTYIRDVTKVEKEWLVDGAPQYYNVKGKGKKE